MSDDRDEGPLLAVTTRSRLRGARFFPAMMLATLRIRRQLARTDGLVRFASLVAGPTEFWTISVWRSRHAMQEFTRSDEHGRIMWRFSRWLHSLWLMRWRPGSEELGSWSGLRLAPSQRAQAPAPVQSWPELAGALENLPTLGAAVNEHGVASFASSPDARRDRRRVEGAAGVLIRIKVSRWRSLFALRELVRLRRGLADQPALLRSVVGIGRPGEAYFLSVWADQEAADGFLTGQWAQEAARRWGAGFWAGAWLPENEFGHWDGMRVRRERRRRERHSLGQEGN